MIGYYVLAFLLGVLVALLWIFRIASGTLKVYVTDKDDGPYLCVELNKTVGEVSKKKYVLFEVDVRDINSQK